VYLADKESRQTPHKLKSEEGDAAVAELCTESRGAAADCARLSVHGRRLSLSYKACCGSGERG